jgi:retron-type reverse transcriptase
MLTQGQTRWSILPLSTMHHLLLAKVLATSFLAGESTVEEIIVRGRHTLGRAWAWLRPLAKRYVHAFAGRTRPRHRQVVRFLLEDRGFRQACSRHSNELSVHAWMAEPMQMQPVGTATAWGLPVIDSTGGLADWLGIEISELEWFADLKGLAYKRDVSRLRHFHYRILAKRSGSIRLIESPKARLKELQRKILREILERIPAHPAVHGFRKGRSIKTFVAPHVGRRVVVRMDLQDFFPSLSGARIQTFFRTLGYPEDVADLLGGICTNATPHSVWKEPGLQADRRQLWEVRDLYSRPHVPQGAPTSPGLANLCFYRADCRLAGLAKSAGAEYTRYADDLAFSGDASFARSAERFFIHAAAIVMEEGFRVHHRKTRVMRQSVRQHLAGLVANQKLNVRRTDFDRLKATLTNCVRLGPVSQNREAHPQFQAHLEGRVGFVESINPDKGKRLRAIYQRIRWE